MSETCRDPSGDRPCPFSTGPESCWPGVQKLAIHLGRRGLDCPHYVLAMQATEEPE